MSPTKRVLSSLLGVVPGLIAIPILMSSWAPAWAVISWWVAYFTITLAAWVFILRRSPSVERWWSVGVGVMVGLLPISAHVFGPGTSAIWIASLMCMLAIAIEVSSLPYLPNFDWRVGPGLIGTFLTIALVLEVGAVGLTLAPILVVIFRNGDLVREAKVALEQSIAEAEAESAIAQELAINDELTGLLNRRGLVTELERLTAQGDYTIVMFDADRFKAINDAHGHGAGDRVLQGMATAIVERLPAPWVVARQGGDEFVAVIAGHDAPVPESVCRPVDCAISMYGAETTIQLGMSGGLVHARAGDEIDRVLSKSGYTMREAKRRKGGLVSFSDELEVRFDRMLKVTAASSDGLEDAFDADFQIVVLADGTIVGCEALCRWRRPDGTTLPPGDFLPILSESGRMGMLNELMLRKGVAFAARFNDLPDGPFVSVNIGSSHLGSGGLVPFIRSLLDEFSVEPDRLMIEITEQEFFNQEASWHRDAVELQELGVHLAIDDFGAGYSNIDRLNTLPISHLKFDRSLTPAVCGPLGSVIRGVVRFADATNIGIIAEGIETADEFEAMASIGVPFFQGYFFDRPQSPAQVEARIRERLIDSGSIGARAA